MAVKGSTKCRQLLGARQTFVGTGPSSYLIRHRRTRQNRLSRPHATLSTRAYMKVEHNIAKATRERHLRLQLATSALLAAPLGVQAHLSLQHKLQPWSRQENSYTTLSRSWSWASKHLKSLTRGVAESRSQVIRLLAWSGYLGGF